MAHFAKLDENNVVVDVIVISNEVCGEPTLTFPDTEAAGRAFIANVLRLDGVWKQTSYNTYIDESGTSTHRNGGVPFRGRYASVGFKYDAVNDVFVAPWEQNAE